MRGRFSRILGLLPLLCLLTGFCFESGTTTGTGVARTVTLTTATSCPLKLVWIKAQSGSFAGVMYNAALAADTSFEPLNNTATFANGITAVGTGSFDLGTDTRVNSNGVVYDYAVWGSDSRNDFDWGSYTGNGTDNHDITIGQSWTPGFVYAKCAGAEAFARSDANSGDQSCGTFSSSGCVANRIQSFAAGSFQVGTNAVNTAATTCTYFAFQASNTWQSNTSYTSNIADSSNITTLTLTPVFATIRCSPTSGGAATAYRFAGDVGDLSYFANAQNLAANIIQNFQTNGFQIGTAASVNPPTGTCFASAWSVPPAVTVAARNRRGGFWTTTGGGT